MLYSVLEYNEIAYIEKYRKCGIYFTDVKNKKSQNCRTTLNKNLINSYWRRWQVKSIILCKVVPNWQTMYSARNTLYVLHILLKAVGVEHNLNNINIDSCSQSFTYKLFSSCFCYYYCCTTAGKYGQDNDVDYNSHYPQANFLRCCSLINFCFPYFLSEQLLNTYQ